MTAIRSKLWFNRRSWKVNSTFLTNHIILVTGMPRSGSTLIFNLCQLLCEHSATPLVRSAWVNDFQFRLTSKNVVILKIHDFDDSLKANKIIHSFRDIREIAASLYVKEKELPTIKELASYLSWDEAWKSKSDITFAYSDLTNLETLIPSVAKTLAIKNFDMNAIQKKLEQLNDGNTKLIYNESSLRHPNHISGAGQSWRSILPKDYVRKIEQAFF